MNLPSELLWVQIPVRPDIYLCLLIALLPPADLWQGEAINLIEEGKAPRIIQWEGGATYDKLWKKDFAKVCTRHFTWKSGRLLYTHIHIFAFQINWDQPALSLHNFVRGNDKLPGAWTTIDGQVKNDKAL